MREPSLKDHEIAQLVNDLRDIAVQFHGAQQLRQRIAERLVPVLKAQPFAPQSPVGYFSMNAQSTYFEVDPEFKNEPGVFPLYARPTAPVKPIDMVLFCPACGLQHIDEAEIGTGAFGPGALGYRPSNPNLWTNPSHRSHLCAGCGHIWRPADVPTNGVEAVKTQGKADSPIVTAQPRYTPRQMAQSFAAGMNTEKLLAQAEEQPQCNDCGVSAIGVHEAHCPEAAAQPIPSGPLHPDTAMLVVRFSVALAAKLLKAEKKYGYTNQWARPWWMNECRAELVRHVAKGDPLDVAAYCAFLWAHGEKTYLQPAAPAVSTSPAMEILLDEEEAARLRDYIGDADRDISLVVMDAYAGFGLYAFDTEYPDEGGEFIAAAPKGTP